VPADTSMAVEERLEDVGVETVDGRVGDVHVAETVTDPGFERAAE